MRIGIDCRLWATTTGRYIRENVKQIASVDTENEYVLFMLPSDINSKEYPFVAPENFRVVPVDIHWHTFKEQLVFPFIALKEKLDVLHIPYFNVPIFYPKRFITTIHDLTILKIDTGKASTHAYWFYKMKKLGYMLAIWVGVKRASHVIAVSKHVKNDIVRRYNVKESKVKVIYNGVSSDFKRTSDDLVEETIKKYNIKKPYLFYVGNAHPHKNVERLLRAFELVVAQHPDLMLVLGGKKYFFYEKLENEWKGRMVYSNLNFAGYLDDKDLPALYTGAEAFVNPSLYEGFGLQLLEAFSCGTKVVCSNTTSLPEVGGDVAFYFDPRSVSDIAHAIERTLINDSQERVEKGYERVKMFSWEVSAQKHIEIYAQKKGEPKN